ADLPLPQEFAAVTVHRRHQATAAIDRFANHKQRVSAGTTGLDLAFMQRRPQGQLLAMSLDTPTFVLRLLAAGKAGPETVELLLRQDPEIAVVEVDHLGAKAGRPRPPADQPGTEDGEKVGVLVVGLPDAEQPQGARIANHRQVFAVVDGRKPQ